MSEIQLLFDRIAPVYDRLNDWLSFGQHRIWKQMAVSWSGAGAKDVCLDLCCGSGDLAVLLSQKCGPEGRVCGVDFSAQMLEVADKREKPWLYPSAPIEWIEADALSLPFCDNFFDAATAGYGLRNVTDIPQCLRELYRVLKPGAKAALLDFHRPANPMMQTFQQWYLNGLVVPAAKTFGLTEEYAYITPSLEKFPTGPEQVRLAEKAGYSKATHYPLAGGMMGVLVVTK
ncbi:MAG TPA: bifunctional demethylmenaquinone methyltransferase/2-methoxy-6-polyprenyl-1,4-benzoquinol methylase UbiE [Halomicronema sp.]